MNFQFTKGKAEEFKKQMNVLNVKEKDNEAEQAKNSTLNMALSI